MTSDQLTDQLIGELTDQLIGELMDVIVGACLLGACLLGASLLGVRDQEDRLTSHAETACGQP